MIAEHNCFPEEWIGKELFISDDAHVCFIGGKDSVYKIIVSDYKIISALWIPDGVIRIDLDSNGLKHFYVGFQRFYEAYGEETEPHDRYSFNKAVEECKRERAAEAERKNPRKESIDSSSSYDEDDVKTSTSKSSSSKDDDSSCVKLIFTIIPVLPVWWLIKLCINGGKASVHILWYIIKLPFYIVSWPLRILSYCFLSKEQRRLLPKSPDVNIYPHYSFKQF